MPITAEPGLYFAAATIRTHRRPLPHPTAPHNGMAEYFAQRSGQDNTRAWADYHPAQRSAFALMCSDALQVLGAAALDLVAVSHADPDSAPEISVAGYLAARRDDEPLVVSVSDQGRLAPFSALELLLAYRRARPRFHGSVLALSHATNPFPLARPEAERADEAVCLTFADTGRLRLAGLAQFPDADRAEVASWCADQAGLLSAGTPLRLLTADAALLGQMGEGARHAVPTACRPGRLWRRSATVLTRAVRDRESVIVADYDDSVGSGAAAVLAFAGRQRAGLRAAVVAEPPWPPEGPRQALPAPSAAQHDRGEREQLVGLVLP